MIPASVTEIEHSAFAGNQLTSIALPTSLTAVGEGAFQGNPLTSVQYCGLTPGILSSQNFPVTLACAQAPNAPSIASVVAASSTSVTVAFTALAAGNGGPAARYIATSSPGGITGFVNQSGSGVLTVNGLSPATSYIFTVQAVNAAGTSNASVAWSAVSTKFAGLTPVFGTPTATEDGFTVQISNYDANYSWQASATDSGVVVVSNSGVVTVSGLAQSASSELTVTSSRTGYDSATASLTSAALEPTTTTASTTTEPTTTIAPTTTSTTPNSPVPTTSTSTTITPTTTTISLSVVGSLTPQQIQSLTKRDVSQIAPEVMSAFSTKQIDSFLPGLVKVLSGSQVLALTVKQISSLDGNQVAAITPAVFKTTALKMIPALDIQAVDDIKPVQLRVLPPPAVAAFSAPQLSVMRPHQIRAFSGRQVAAVKPDALRAAAPNVLAAWRPSIAKYVTIEQLKSLSMANLWAIPREVYREFNLEQRKAIRWAIPMQ